MENVQNGRTKVVSTLKILSQQSRILNAKDLWNSGEQGHRKIRWRGKASKKGHFCRRKGTFVE